MDVLLLWLAGMIAVLLGKVLMGRWVNHLSVYSGIWTVSLGLYSLKWIPYHTLTTEAWLYIALAGTVLS